MIKRGRTTILKIPLTYKEKVDNCIEKEGFEGSENEYLETVLTEAIEGKYDKLANEQREKVEKYVYTVNQNLNRNFIQRAKLLGYGTGKEFLRHILEVLYNNTKCSEKKNLVNEFKDKVPESKEKKNEYKYFIDEEP